jgi:hypothetical protein
VSYTSQRVEYSDRHEVGVKVDPVVLRAAKQIYRYYVDAYATQLPRPLGIAVNRDQMSGKLVYTQLILLPKETFVPIELIESGDHY